MDLDALLLESMALQQFDSMRDCFSCGCQQRGARWHLCSYHEGYQDGLEAMNEKVGNG